MRRILIGAVFVLAAGTAEAQSLPSCRGLVPVLAQDPSSIDDGEPLLGVDEIVADPASAGDRRLCTGIARYRSSSTHVTYVATWRDSRHTLIEIDAHDTTADEAAARARALRLARHPKGEDGTYDASDFLPRCADPAFLRLAQTELRLGISVKDGFYREPGYTVYALHENGDESGYNANCVATVGDGHMKGDLFLGTQWVDGELGERFEFYVLDAGPEDFTITNRLWMMSTE